MEEYRKQLGPPTPDHTQALPERVIPGGTEGKSLGFDPSSAPSSSSIVLGNKYLPRAVSELMTAPTPEDGTDLLTSADQLMATGRWERVNTKNGGCLKR